MKVKEVMTQNPKTCTPTSNLAEVAGLMWENDCGIVPVVAEGGNVVGLITDRDICMAAALTGRSLENIAVAEVTSGNVVSCNADDDLRPALQKLEENRVRRLAVVAGDGTLEGILSLNDIVLIAQEAADDNTSGVSYAEVIATYKGICEHPQPIKVAAAGA